MVTESPKTSANYEKNLYEQDYYLWLEKTAQILKEGSLQKLDLPNLIEEIEDMGRSEKRTIESNLIIVLIHLLKYKYQAEKRSNSWKFTIKEHRRRLKKNLKESPSLKNYFAEIFAECYQDAKDLAATETGLSLDAFPSASPFTPEETLNPDYLPD
jgi:hypothetical protein